MLILLVIAFWFIIVVIAGSWGYRRSRRARADVRSALERQGFRVVDIRERMFRLGAFSVWDTSRTQYVFRIVVREPDGGHRTVWARWGRPWLTGTDRLELRWEPPPLSNAPPRTTV